MINRADAWEAPWPLRGDALLKTVIGNFINHESSGDVLPGYKIFIQLFIFYK